MKQLFTRLLPAALAFLLLAGCGKPATAPTTQAPTTTAEPTVTTEATEAVFRGLTLQVPEGVQVTLYTGFTDTVTTILPTRSSSENGINSFCYPVLTGPYHYIASGEGYYTVRKCLLLTGEPAVIDADPGKRSGLGYEPKEANEIMIYTDQLLDTIAVSDPSLWPQLSEGFSSPFFTNTDRAEHQFTTHQEMMDFLRGLDGADDNMYLFTPTTSPAYELEIPVVIFTQTDLSGASTLEEAAALLDPNKLMVHYQAQIHGNEPAAGESALGMAAMLDGSLGPDLLDSMDIYMIPRMNVDGSQDHKRTNVFSVTDMNRDMLQVRSREISLHHGLMNLFMPEVRIDSHEYTVAADGDTGKYNDMCLSTGYTPINSQEFQAFSQELAGLPFEALREQGLRPSYYSRTINDNNPNTGRIYASQLGCISILLESYGIHYGTTAYARRVAGHLISAMKYLNYLDENAQQVKDLVQQERDYIISRGSTYEEEDLVILQTDRTSNPNYLNMEPIYLFANGTEESTERTTPYVYDRIIRSRPRPTAYVIPDIQSMTAQILQIMDIHGIAYEYLAPGSRVYLQQYTGTLEEAQLSDEALVTFPDGAYVFYMDQVRGNILALLMEPDCNDAAAYDGTLAQSGRLPLENGMFPLYRYIRDLNSSGTIDIQ